MEEAEPEEITGIRKRRGARNSCARQGFRDQHAFIQAGVRDAAPAGAGRFLVHRRLCFRLHCRSPAMHRSSRRTVARLRPRDDRAELRVHCPVRAFGPLDQRRRRHMQPPMLSLIALLLAPELQQRDTRRSSETPRLHARGLLHDDQRRPNPARMGRTIKRDDAKMPPRPKWAATFSTDSTAAGAGASSSDTAALDSRNNTPGACLDHIDIRGTTHRLLRARADRRHDGLGCGG
jgi:hypothetical protein